MTSSPEEMQELQEAAEHGQHEARLAPVSLTMAILAVFVAAVSVLGHRAHTEEIIFQNRVTDTWAYYQAKNTQRQTTELFLDLLKVSEFKHPETEALKHKYQDAIGTFAGKQDEIKAEARKLEAEMDLERRRADRFDLSESFLEVALVVTSITLLTRKRVFWAMGFVAAAIGLVVAITGLTLH